jgi:hypothetical protein
MKETPGAHARPTSDTRALLFLTLVPSESHRKRSGSRQLAVVGPLDGRRLIGLLTMSDIVRAHARAAMDAEDYDRPELPALSASPRLSEEK